jgi:hypothetical protein
LKGLGDEERDGIASAAKNFKGFDEVESAPFIPNSAFVFAPCSKSWHGVPNIQNNERDTIQGFITIEKLENKKKLKTYLRGNKGRRNDFFDNYGRKVQCEVGTFSSKNLGNDEIEYNEGSEINSMRLEERRARRKRRQFWLHTFQAKAKRMDSYNS